MSVINQDRGTIVASGRVVLTDDETAEVRAIGVASYIVEGEGFLSFELVQPLEAAEAHIIARRTDTIDGQVTAVVEDVGGINRVFFFIWGGGGDLEKNGAFYFEISRVVGGPVTVTAP